jgi:aryl-alcohol dehydrogenase-like predicted oxidoreductase
MSHPLALGAMLFGTDLDESTSFAILDRFVDAGGTWIDTANCYAFWADPTGSGGQSERLLGRWLASRPGVRDHIKLSTKVGCEPTVVGGFPDHVEGLSAPAIERGIQGSLRRLGTDYIDLYWAHMDDRTSPLGETVASFGKLVADGVVGRVGCSNYAIWRVERARQIARDSAVAGFTAVQQHHTYLQPRPGTRPTSSHRFGTIDDQVIDYVHSNPDMDVWAYSPLLGGRYTRNDRPLAPEYDHAGTTRRLAALDDVVAQTGASRNQVVLAWLIGASPAARPIIGVSSTTQLDEALAGASLTLSEDQRIHLDTAE